MKKLFVIMFFSVLLVGNTSYAKEPNSNKIYDIVDTDTSNTDNLTTESQTTEQPVINEVTTEANEDEQHIDFDSSDPFPTVDEKGFFKNIYEKGWSGINIAQKIVLVICVFMFVLNAGALVIACFGSKHFGKYIVGLIICVLIVVVDLSAVEICAAVNNFFRK